MISYLKGKIIYRGKNHVIISIGNIGYRVYTLPGQEMGDGEIEIYTHLAVREDAHTLYGFKKIDELELFEILISVSGVGPKSALGILSISDPDTIKYAIAKGDASILTRVSGIGKKTADRIILELRNKFSISAESNLEEKGREIMDHTDALEALVGLGYRPAEAKKALSKISPDIKDVGEKIRMALKGLGKK